MIQLILLMVTGWRNAYDEVRFYGIGSGDLMHRCRDTARYGYVSTDTYDRTCGRTEADGRTLTPNG